MLYDNILDIIKHTHNLGFIEVVKVTGDQNTTTLEAISAEKTVVFNGTLNKPIPELDGHTVGLGRMAVLNGYVNFPMFKDNPNGIKIGLQQRGSDTVPAEIQFDSGSGHKAQYRFMSDTIVNTMVKVPPFKGANWDIIYSPTQKNLKDLQYFNQILGAFEKTFTVVTENNNLKFRIGSDSNDCSVVPFAENITATIPEFSWPLMEVINILKLNTNSGKCTMKFSSVGALMIEINSGVGEYTYILPARS